MPQGRLVLNCC